MAKVAIMQILAEGFRDELHSVLLLIFSNNYYHFPKIRKNKLAIDFTVPHEPINIEEADDKSKKIQTQDKGCKLKKFVSKKELFFPFLCCCIVERHA